MKLVAVTLALALGGASFAAKGPMPLVTHAATFYLGFADGTCSGAAIGPQLVLSAAHCFESGPLVKIAGIPCKQVGEALLDGNDHAIIKVDCKFAKWAQMGGKLRQGDELRWWGNPMGLSDIFRRGYVMGWEQGWALVDAPVQRGDSGSAIFDKRGRIVSVVSTLFIMGEGFHGMGCKPLAYSREQLASVGL